MGQRLAVCAAALALLALPSPASGANQTYYVNESNPNAFDFHIVNNMLVPNFCVNPDVPCRSIIWAEGFADGSNGNTVRVLADPSGQTDDYIGNVEVGDGSNATHAVTLIGAGNGQGGTRIAGTTSQSGQALRLVDDSRASDLAVSQANSNAAGIVDAGTGLVERVATNVPQGVAYSSISGTVVDSTLRGRDGSYVGGLSARDVFVGDLLGLDAGQISGTPARILDSIVASAAGDPQGIGVRVRNTGTSVAADLRGVTVTGWNTRLLVQGSPLSATARLVNSTLAGTDTSTTDISVSGSSASLALDHVNRSPGRSSFGNGATAAQLSDVSPIDVAPGLTGDDGHLAPGSPLVDRGTTGGVLAGDPQDALDVDRQPRLAGAAPDVGADELAPPGTPSIPSSSDPPPVATGVRVSPFTFRLGSLLQKLARRRSTPTRTTIRFVLSEAATAKLTFARRLPGRRVGRRCRPPSRALKRRRGCTRLVTVRGATLSVKGKQGLNRLRFAGRLSRRRRLAPGAYQLTLVATDSAGQRSKVRTANFRLLPAVQRRR